MTRALDNALTLGGRHLDARRTGRRGPSRFLDVHEAVIGLAPLFAADFQKRRVAQPA